MLNLEKIVYVQNIRKNRIYPFGRMLHYTIKPDLMKNIKMAMARNIDADMARAIDPLKVRSGSAS